MLSTLSKADDRSRRVKTTRHHYPERAVVSHFEWICLSAVTWKVSRLGRAEQVMGIQVGEELPQNYFLNDLGQERKV